MKNRIIRIIGLFQACICLAALLLFATLIASISGRRPDLWIYPIYKSVVAEEEKNFQNFVDEICAQKKCEDKYEVKVYIWTVPFFADDAYMAQNKKAIFLKKEFYR